MISVAFFLTSVKILSLQKQGRLKRRHLAFPPAYRIFSPI
ncbi:hypothetical protein B4119_1099 [Parageobacillus caldoxylosilyticus]|uniref:Uncharacterized protein n=1 Tax=Saccharococcus caldoxylosilyticus TaxID=81408 RepID=A0A150L4G5_9BACL|nr:hypothetical protein B4119_1099 [Parageobacillus caldoxylosilyticus]